MSRTDKTAPFWVKTHYYPSWLKEEHDHRSGPCDLPPRPDPHNEYIWGTSPDQRCDWVASMAFYSSSMSNCPCPMCRPGAYWSGDPRNRKVIRREGRRQVRDWDKEY